MSTFMHTLVFTALITATSALSAAPIPYDGIAATVGNEVITIENVMTEFKKGYNLASVPAEERTARLAALYPQVLNLLIDRLLILQAYKDAGGVLPPDALEKHIRSIITTNFNGDESALHEALKKNRITYDDWSNETRENLIIASMRYMQVDKKVAVTPSMIKAYYAEHKADFSETPTTHLRVILISPEQGKAVADKAFAEIMGGKPFAEVAKEYSQDSRAADGGDFGYVGVADLSPAINKIIKPLKVGRISRVTEVEGYFYILYKVAERAATIPTLQDAWVKIENKLTSEASAERYQAWMQSLRKNTFILVNEKPDRV